MQYLSCALVRARGIVFRRYYQGIANLIEIIINQNHKLLYLAQLESIEQKLVQKC